MAGTAPGPISILARLGFIMGSAALVLTLVVFWAGPFALQQTGRVTLGELAADIAKAAARSVASERPEEQCHCPS